MADLHLTRIAFGCSGLDVLEARIAARAVNGTVELTTRYRPKRFEELIGGSLFWIIKHQLVARQEITDFTEDEAIRKWNIIIKTPLIVVHQSPRRAHQGWRYLTNDDAPPDIIGASGDAAQLPADLTSKLAGLGLV